MLVIQEMAAEWAEGALIIGCNAPGGVAGDAALVLGAEIAKLGIDPAAAKGKGLGRLLAMFTERLIFKDHAEAWLSPR